MLSLIGLLGALVALIWLTLRGFNLFISAPLCALLVALTSHTAVFPITSEVNFIDAYMGGFASFVKAWFLMFLLGSLFGKLMEECGAADAVARWIVSKLGMQYAVLAVVVACAVLTYGGVSVFIVAFSVYPMALSLFKDANLPRRFIPATLAFGSVTFTMTSAGSPEIQNWIPIQYLGTSPYAAWQESLVIAIVMAVLGYVLLNWMIKQAKANGEHFESRDGDPESTNRALPHPLTGLLPLFVVLGLSYYFHDLLKQSALIVALLGGVLSLLVINWRYFSRLHHAVGYASTGALVAIGNTAAVVGFGSVAKLSPAFQEAVSVMMTMPGHELVGAAIAVSVIAGLTGSASGGQAIALPLVAPHYLDAGVSPEQLHRIVAISSGALDTLPHNGYVVTTIRAICNEKHETAYWPLALLTVVVPLLGLLLILGLFIWF
ncbi:SLC13 family permease [Pseudoalteromonas xiamenensis]|uniref:GntP family permease n=1 Tax=Pseudoalteromonas xiamenensis TaxID=882626 RepID=UPI0027E4387E|nr:SLC13 family permease [Pseudoalteromonas xiamenensis]WMN58546.1 SLC13 family permease [Pseudoalteromonas xiamenensis]